MPSSEDYWFWDEIKNKAYAAGIVAARAGLPVTSNPEVPTLNCSSTDYNWRMGWEHGTSAMDKAIERLLAEKN